MNRINEKERYEYIRNPENTLKSLDIPSLVESLKTKEEEIVRIGCVLLERIVLINEEMKPILKILRGHFPPHPKLLVTVFEIVKLLDDTGDQITMLELIHYLSTNSPSEVQTIFFELKDLMLTDRRLCVFIFGLFSEFSSFFTERQNDFILEMSLGAIRWIEEEDLPVLIDMLLKTCTRMRENTQALKVVNRIRSLFVTEKIEKENDEMLEDEEEDESNEKMTDEDEKVSENVIDDDTDVYEDDDNDDNDEMHVIVNEENLQIVHLLVSEIFSCSFKVNMRLKRVFVTSLEQSTSISHFDILLFLVLMKTTFEKNRERLHSVFYKFVRFDESLQSDFITLGKVKDTFVVFREAISEYLFDPFVSFLNFLFKEDRFEEWCYEIFPLCFSIFPSVRSVLLSTVISSLSSFEYEKKDCVILQRLMSYRNEKNEFVCRKRLSEYLNLFESPLYRSSRYKYVEVVHVLVRLILELSDERERMGSARFQNLFVFLRKHIFSFNEKDISVGIITSQHFLDPRRRQFLKHEDRRRCMEWMFKVISLSSHHISSRDGKKGRNSKPFVFLCSSSNSFLSLHSFIHETMSALFETFSIEEKKKLWVQYFSKFKDIFDSKIRNVDLNNTVYFGKNKENYENEVGLFFLEGVENESKVENWINFFQFCRQYFILYFKFANLFSSNHSFTIPNQSRPVFFSVMEFLKMGYYVRFDPSMIDGGVKIRLLSYLFVHVFGTIFHECFVDRMKSNISVDLLKNYFLLVQMKSYCAKYFTHKIINKTFYYFKLRIKEHFRIVEFYLDNKHYDSPKMKDYSHRVLKRNVKLMEASMFKQIHNFCLVEYLCRKSEDIEKLVTISANESFHEISPLFSRQYFEFNRNSQISFDSESFGEPWKIEEFFQLDKLYRFFNRSMKKNKYDCFCDFLDILIIQKTFVETSSVSEKVKMIENLLSYFFKSREKYSAILLIVKLLQLTENYDNVEFLGTLCLCVFRTIYTVLGGNWTFIQNHVKISPLLEYSRSFDGPKVARGKEYPLKLLFDTIKYCYHPENYESFLCDFVFSLYDLTTAEKDFENYQEEHVKSKRIQRRKKVKKMVIEREEHPEYKLINSINFDVLLYLVFFYLFDQLENSKNTELYVNLFCLYYETVINSLKRVNYLKINIVRTIKNMVNLFQKLEKKKVLNFRSIECLIDKAEDLYEIFLKINEKNSYLPKLYVMVRRLESLYKQLKIDTDESNWTLDGEFNKFLKKRKELTLNVSKKFDSVKDLVRNFDEEKLSIFVKRIREHFV